MNNKNMTIRLGGEEVPLIKRPSWESNEIEIPYRQTYSLLPGENWCAAEVHPKMSERYVKVNENKYIPVGAKIAQELVAGGADKAVFTELSGPYMYLS